MASEDIHYKVIIKTGESGIHANVMLCIFGDAETTPNLPLTQTKDGVDANFTVDSILEFDLQAVDVGKIKKINIGHDGKGADHQWFLKSVTIGKKDENYKFKAQRWLSEEKEDHKTYIDVLPIEPQTSPVVSKDQATYDIIIITSSDDQAGTDSGVLMTIFGDQDATKQFPLAQTKQGDKALFDTGKTNEFQMELDDVGQINKINIGLDGKGHDSKWHLKSVQIHKGSQTYNFHANKILDQSTAFVDLTPAPPAKKTLAAEPTAIVSPRNPAPEQKVAKKDITYKVSIRTGSLQQDIIDDNTPVYLVIHGQNEQSKKLFLKDGTVTDKKHAFKKDEKTDFELKSHDVGKIRTIVIGQEKSDQSAAWHVDNVTIKHGHETTTFNAERIVEESAEIELQPSAIPKKNDTTYKILLRTGTQQEEGDESQLHITILGANGQTKQIPLNETTTTHKKITFKKEETIEFESKDIDVGKISKIVLSQDALEQNTVWHIDHITIKRGANTTTFNLERKLEQQAQVEIVPSPIPIKSETPRRPAKKSEPVSKPVMKSKDSDYEITICTGDHGLDASVTIKIRGDNGTVSIPLSNPKSGAQPFQPNSIDEFTCRTNDVDKIRRINIEHNETDREKIWHLKNIQIKKGTETYNFHADVVLDDKQNQVNLYPVGALFGHQKEDYVQTELRRLREGLRVESSKLRPPTSKAHEPFVFNDLSPYFDTSHVERAIYSPLETPPGYYTRVTSLRIVEPWEAYGMSFGVNYELAKQRKGRSFSSKRSTVKSTDDSVDRSQGSTHLPKFPRIDIKKPKEYSGPLNVNDVPKIRSFIRDRYSSDAEDQMQQDYKRTRDDLYRMQLDDLNSYHESNRDNMVSVYHSYLDNTRGAKKALREFCDQLAPHDAKKASVNATN